MLQVNDIIRQTMITEVDGVAISNTFHYIVKENDLATTVHALALAVHADWWDQIDDIISSFVATTCSIWSNLSGHGTTFPAFQTIVGGVLDSDYFPPETAVALTSKAIGADGLIKHGTHKMSGFISGLHTDGHIDDYEEGLLLKTWLTTDRVYGPTILRSVQPAVIAEVQTFAEVIVVQTNPHLKKIPSRRSTLCRTQQELV
jgi:hypothetical protein